MTEFVNQYFVLFSSGCNKHAFKYRILFLIAKTEEEGMMLKGSFTMNTCDSHELLHSADSHTHILSVGCQQTFSLAN